MGSRPASAASDFKLTSLTFTVYLPTILFSIGEGAIIPVIPLFAKHLGASIPAASLVVALRGIGQLVFDMPAGLAVARVGDKWAMVVGTGMVSSLAIGAALSPSPIALGGIIFIMGGGWAFWQLARQDYVAEMSPTNQRGRAMSMLGGMNRIGNFIGPVIGGVLANQFGLEAAFAVLAVVGLTASGTMLVSVEGVPGATMQTSKKRVDLIGIVRDNRQSFLTAGASMVVLSLLRQARQVFLPLWGDAIGLDVAAIGVVFSIGSFVDAAVFYPSGYIMDRWGRKWAGVPCLLVLAVSLLLLPLTHAMLTFTVIAIVSGVGNGLGSGIVMTLGADLAPVPIRSQFLGIWRLLADAGQAAGPMLISAVTGLATLGLAAVATGGVGLVGAAMMIRFVNETLRPAALIEEVETTRPTPANVSD